MGAKRDRNRQKIVTAASELFYAKGFNQTSFTDIAAAAGLCRGNFYYYFKSKDDILSAVIEYRLAGMRAMLAEWDQQYSSPRERLKRFVRTLSHSEEDILRYGCPIGSLTAELAKTQLHLHGEAAKLFDLLRQWLEAQISELGERSQAPKLALHVLALTQGISLIGNVYADPAFLQQESARLSAWIDTV